jgi:hypothetical protein
MTSMVCGGPYLPAWIRLPRKKFLHMLQKTGSQTQARLAARQQQLKDADAMEPEELAALKTQQRILAVDLAGAQAQMETATKLLFNRNRLSPSRIEQLECIKTATEIELARLSGRQKILASLIAGAQQQRVDDASKVVANPLGQVQPSGSDLATPAASHEAGVELLSYCEALCAADLEFHDCEELPAPPPSHDHLGAQTTSR